MCYFVELNLPRQELEKRFGVPMHIDPRYMQGVFFSAFKLPLLPVISSEQPDIITLKQWGLIPSWVKNSVTAEKIRMTTFNAKAETIWEKPSFRSAARYKRCLVLAHGFFEYHSLNKYKIPFYIRRKDNKAFAFAGLYESWTDQVTGEIIDSCNIITVPANPLLRKIHNVKQRMPAILDEETEREWINPENRKTELELMLKPADENLLEAYSISKNILQVQPGQTDLELLKKVDYNELNSLFDA